LLQQILADAVAQVALELDGVVRHGPARPARALELLTELAQKRRIAWQVEHHGDDFPAAPLLLDPQLRDDFTGLRWDRYVHDRASAAFAVGHRPAATGAHPA